MRVSGLEWADLVVTYPQHTLPLFKHHLYTTACSKLPNSGRVLLLLLPSLPLACYYFGLSSRSIITALKIPVRNQPRYNIFPSRDKVTNSSVAGTESLSPPLRGIELVNRHPKSRGGKWWREEGRDESEKERRLIPARSTDRINEMIAEYHLSTVYRPPCEHATTPSSVGSGTHTTCLRLSSSLPPPPPPPPPLLLLLLLVLVAARLVVTRHVCRAALNRTNHLSRGR